MFDLAIALLLEQSGYGTYGQDIFWNISPILGSGEVSSKAGIWVNATPQGISGDLYTDTISISTRYMDPIDQSKMMLELMKFGRATFPKLCELSLEPLVPGFTFTNCDIEAPSAVSMDAVDEEGRWVKSIQFTARYKLPTADNPVWKSLSRESDGID